MENCCRNTSTNLGETEGKAGHGRGRAMMILRCVLQSSRKERGISYGNNKILFFEMDFSYFHRDKVKRENIISVFHISEGG